MRGSFLLTALLAAFSMGCGPAVDLTKALQVLDVSTGWLDAGRVSGQNKLVPSVSFKLKNVSDQPVTVLQANILFQRVADPEEWGSGFLTAAGSDGLAPGGTTRPLVADASYDHSSFSWDPAGRLLLMERTLVRGSDTKADTRSQVWVYDADSGGLTRLAVNAFQPHWVP